MVTAVSQDKDKQKYLKNLSRYVIALQVDVFKTEGIVVHLYRIVTLMETASKSQNTVTEKLHHL